jgi:hypothetical protein
MGGSEKIILKKKKEVVCIYLNKPAVLEVIHKDLYNTVKQGR